MPGFTDGAGRPAFPCPIRHLQRTCERVRPVDCGPDFGSAR